MYKWKELSYLLVLNFEKKFLSLQILREVIFTPLVITEMKI